MAQQVCGWCNKVFEVKDIEYRRQVKRGRNLFFCSRSCAAKYGNAQRPNRRVPIRKVCPVCRQSFATMTGAKSPTFCSRSCASRGSVSERRRLAAQRAGLANSSNLSVSAAMKEREAWKYTRLEGFLGFLGERFEFECNLPEMSYIFDLVLFDRKLIVEFDSDYHNWNGQRKVDAQRDIVAKRAGWTVKRITVPKNQIINVDVLYPLLGATGT